jgi:hypothetical protein
MRNLILALLLIFSSASAFAEDHIDIHGFHVGMSNKEYFHHVIEISRQYGHFKVEFGGVVLKLPFNNHGCKNQAGCSLFFTGTVDWFQFNFDAKQFEQVKTAVVAQYPDTVCAGDACTYETAAEKLTLTAGNIEVSVK